MPKLSSAAVVKYEGSEERALLKSGPGNYAIGTEPRHDLRAKADQKATAARRPGGMGM